MSHGAFNLHPSGVPYRHPSGVFGVGVSFTKMLVMAGIAFDGDWSFSSAGEHKQNVWMVPRAALPDQNDEDLDGYSARVYPTGVSYPPGGSGVNFSAAGSNATGPTFACDRNGAVFQFNQLIDGGGPYTATSYSTGLVYETPFSDVYGSSFSFGAYDMLTDRNATILRTGTGVHTTPTPSSIQYVARTQYDATGNWQGDLNDRYPNGPIFNEGTHGRGCYDGSQHLTVGRTRNRFSGTIKTYVSPGQGVFFEVPGLRATCSPALRDADKTFWVEAGGVAAEYIFASGYASAPTFVRTLTPATCPGGNFSPSATPLLPDLHYHTDGENEYLISTGSYIDGSSDRHQSIRIIDLSDDTLHASVNIETDSVGRETYSSVSDVDSEGNTYIAVWATDGLSDYRFAVHDTLKLYCYDIDCNQLWVRDIAPTVNRRWIASVHVNF